MATTKLNRIFFTVIIASLFLLNAVLVMANDDAAAVDDDPMHGNDCKDGPCNRTPRIRHLWYAHAILMSVSFLILIPAAIIGSLIRKILPAQLWFKVHTILNWTALTFIFSGFAIAVYIVSKRSVVSVFSVVPESSRLVAILLTADFALPTETGNQELSPFLHVLLPPLHWVSYFSLAGGSFNVRIFPSRVVYSHKCSDQRGKGGWDV